jgi:ribose transport system ATP-binding protein
MMGTITIDGNVPVAFQNPRQAMERGIGMVFQEQSLIPNLTVMENIFLGYEQQFVNGWGMINWKAMATAARRTAGQGAARHRPELSRRSLSFAQRQLVELAKVLTLEERVDGDLVILLDEPTSVLSKDEVELLFKSCASCARGPRLFSCRTAWTRCSSSPTASMCMKDGAVVDVVDSERMPIDRCIQHKMVGPRGRQGILPRAERNCPTTSETAGLVSTRQPWRGSKRLVRSASPARLLCLVGTEGSGREAIYANPVRTGTA